MQILNTTDVGELLKLTSEYCNSDCVTVKFPACTSLDPSIKAVVDQINQGFFFNNSSIHVKIASVKLQPVHPLLEEALILLLIIMEKRRWFTPLLLYCHQLLLLE